MDISEVNVSEINFLKRIINVLNKYIYSLYRNRNTVYIILLKKGGDKFTLPSMNLT